MDKLWGETVVCRCEGVTWDAVTEAREKFGLTSLRQLKLVTRMGMGICQGRTCRPLAEAWAEAWGLQRGGDQLALRDPLRPVSFASVAEMEAGE